MPGGTRRGIETVSPKFNYRVQLRQLPTGRERPDAVVEQPRARIRTLADRLGRDVHDDLHVRADDEIVHVRTHGRAKQPDGADETDRVAVEFERSREAGSAPPRSAWRCRSRIATNEPGNEMRKKHKSLS